MTANSNSLTPFINVELNMDFGKKIKLESDLNIEEILSRLNSVTERFHSDSDKKYKFEGVISASKFQILPTFDFSPRNQLRPEIIGEIFCQQDRCVIDLEFSISKHLLLPIVLILTLNLAFVLLLFLKPIHHIFTWKVFALLLIFSIVIFYVNFNLKIKSSEKILNKVLNAVVI